MTIIDENGQFKLLPGTLKAVDGDHPVYRARIALALGKNTWMFAPDSGHELAQFDRAKASDAGRQAYEKALELYLRPYGASVGARITSRGTLVLEEAVTKETISE